RERLPSEIKKLMAHQGPNHPRHDIQEFQQAMEEEQQNAINVNPKDWNWVFTQARNFIDQRKFDNAEALFLKHIQVSRGAETVAQAYINLIALRLNHMKRPAEAQVA